MDTFLAARGACERAPACTAAPRLGACLAQWCCGTRRLGVAESPTSACTTCAPRPRPRLRVGLAEPRKDCGAGLYTLLGIGRQDKAKKEAQIRRNFEFFGAPTVMFVFV